MINADAWSVKGVGLEARQAAEEAARRAGLSVGDWLDEVIAARAAELGVDVDSVGSNERLEAITAKIARISQNAGTEPQGEAKSSRDWRNLRSRTESLRETVSRRLWRDRDEAAEMNREEAEGRNPDQDRIDGERTERERMEKNRSERERGRTNGTYELKSPAREGDRNPEARLQAAIDAIERTSAARDERTAEAIANVAQWIKRNETARDGEREALEIITDRLAQLERHIAQRSGDKGYEPIRNALSQLEERIDSLARQAGEAASGSGAFDAKFLDLGDRLTGLTDKIERLERTGSNNERADHFSRLEAKLSAILGSLDRPFVVRNGSEPGDRGETTLPLREPDRDGGSRTPPEQTTPGNRKDGLTNAIDAAVAEISRRQRDLDGDASRPLGRARQTWLRRDASPETEPVPALDFKALDRRLETIADRIERAADLASSNTRADTTALSAVESLHGEIAKLASANSRTDTSNRSAFETLQSEIARLATRLEEVRRPEPHPELMALRTEVAAMSRSLASLAPRASVTAIEDAVRDLTARIEASREEGVRESVLAPVESLAAELRAALKDLDPRATIDALDREIKAIGHKLEQMAERGFDPAALAKIQEQTQEVRDLLTAAAQRPMPTERMERQITALSSRLDEIAAQNAAQRVAGDLATSSEDIRTLLKGVMPVDAFAALENRVESLAAKVDEALARPANQEAIEALSQGIERVQTTLGKQLIGVGDTRPLENLVRRLAESVEAAQRQDADLHAIEAIEAQIAKIMTKLDRSDSGFAALGSLERSIGDLFTRIEESRRAAEGAARAAAQEAMREAMASGIPAAQIEKIGRELLDLRTVQNEADQRTHATLTAVHETLERVVDRLASLEEDSIEKRPGDSNGGRSGASSARGRKEASSPVRSAEVTPNRRDRFTAESLRSAASRPGPVKGAGEAVAATQDSLDFLIEPGSGFAPKRTNGTAPADAARSEPASPDVSGEQSPRSSFIAAARRAAQAAAAESAASAARGRSLGEAKGSAGAEPSAKSGMSRVEQLRAFVLNRKRPILLGLAGLVILLGAYEVMRGMTAPRTVDLEKPAELPAPSDPSKRISPQADYEGGVPPTFAAKGDASAPPSGPTKASAGQGFDMSPVGSVGTTSSFKRPSDGAGTELSDQKPPAPAGGPVAALGLQPIGPAPVLPLREAANAGDPTAEYELGARLTEGRQMGRDLRAAAEWFQKAASQGLVPAEYRLGVAYEKGLGVGQDLPLAKAWYQRAAEAGNAHAMHNLAVVLAEGAGGKPDYVNAVGWFRKAADFGIRDSQFNLGILYARGLGVEQDLSQSFVWFALAAAQGDDDAGKKREEVAKRLDPNALGAAKGIVEAFRAKPVDRAANEVTTPPGGWDARSKAEPKAVSGRPKVSGL
ncbi:MAG: SEL1-like repeat protein [Methylobacteriaceae bacterium]|nr:SEL1-like repeat protein [Methylobacteriaceae bacterium]